LRKFIQRALKKLSKLDGDQIKSLLDSMAAENERLEAVLHSMMDGVLVADNEHKLILYNKSAEPLLIKTSGELYEKKIWNVINDEEVAEFLRNVLQNQEKIRDKEYTLDFQGIIRIFSFSIMPLVSEGKIRGNLIHIEEVTEKRRKEARLRRAENLASLTTLAAGVAHEIKNPLGSMSIHIQLIEKELQRNGFINKESVQQYLGVISEEVNRLNGIVVDFLFAVRPMDSHLEEKDLNQIVLDTVDFIHFELEESGIEIQTELCQDSCNALLDDKLIKQALLNLIKNAAAAMPTGGVIRIQTEKKRGSILLRISDNGIGIPKDILTKIFEPYFTTKEFGSGLGLTVVYKIVKEHQGEISVQSREGEGAEFSLLFPCPQGEKSLIEWEGDSHEA